MRKVIIILIVLFALSCKNKEKGLVLPPIIEKELCKSVYLNQSLKSELYTVETYVDSSIQKVSFTVLSSILKRASADKGFVVVMETNSGKVKALVTLDKDENFKYNFSKNIDINTPIEPGSFIKTFDMMALLEDKKADTSSVYSTHNGKVSFYGKTINDSHEGGFGDISLGKALLYSSNTVFAQAITQTYAKNPNQFVTKFNQFRLGTNLDLPFANSNNQIIPYPKSNNWSNISLPWMSIGYGLTLSPIQILTYYNGIANGGEVVKPLFLAKINNKQEQTKYYEKTILVSKMCSVQTLVQIQDLLKKVVTEGTGLSCKSEKVSIAGKTASVQINYANGGDKQYLSGFVGYFPITKPKYSVITIIMNPKSQENYYGADLAGAVVKEIAEKIK